MYHENEFLSFPCDIGKRKHNITFPDNNISKLTFIFCIKYDTITSCGVIWKINSDIHIITAIHPRKPQEGREDLPAIT